MSKTNTSRNDGTCGHNESIVEFELRRELAQAREQHERLKKHAEAMAKELEAIRDLDGYYFGSVTDIVRAYRAEFPKEAP